MEQLQRFKRITAMSSIADRLQSVASVPPTPAVKGHWFNIRVCPDLALGELLNVGVGYVDSASTKRPLP